MLQLRVAGRLLTGGPALVITPLGLGRSPETAGPLAAGVQGKSTCVA